MEINGFPYGEFNDFVENFLVKRNQYVTEKYSNFSVDVNEITEVKDFIENYNNGNFTKEETKNVLEKCNDNQKIILVHAIWLWAYPYGNRYNKKIALKTDCYDLSSMSLVKKLWDSRQESISSIGAAGSVRMKILPKILELFVNIFSSPNITTKNIKKEIKDRIKKAKDPCSTYNAILHCLDPQNVEPIVSSDDKTAIVKAFNWVDDVSKTLDIDEQISKIKDWLIKQQVMKPDESFHTNDLVFSIWNTEATNNVDLSRIQQLRYKKAMILYGPPGTGKSFTAYEIAKQLVIDYYRHKNNLKACLKPAYDWNKHIVQRQFHVNYTYEDFVGGIVIDKTGTKFNEGFIFEACEKAKKLSGAPFVVILDEINRTDVSRVFGEVFTAMEPDKRGKNFEIAVQDPSSNGKSIEINIPENLYFIGTMNEIDFSLERIDFALRRRFVWNYCGFDKNALETIIVKRLDILKAHQVQDEDKIKYIECCKGINNVVESGLGKQYAIGHAFFADIVYILNEVNFDWEKAKRILWEISIQPTIEAYCGSIDEATQKELIDSCAEEFGVK